jgi:glycosyltransferase involved in cell wall biosynthesis
MNLCIVKYKEITISETFIKAHAERLPVNVTVIEGRLPHVGGKACLSESLVSRVFRKTRRLIADGDAAWNISAAYQETFQKFRANAVLAEYGISGVLVMDACTKAGIPLIVHCHGFDVSDRNILMEHGRTYPELFKKAAAIVSVSEAMRAKLVSLGAPQHKIRTNPYGVDCRLFSATNAASNPPIFIAVGRLVEKKAPYLTLVAFSKVHKSFPEAQLRMIGDGPLLGPCQDLAKVLGMSNCVKFLGSQSHDVVRREMCGSRAFVQHSVEASSGDCEGAPVSIIEACASALPIVSTRHAGIPEIVVDKETGFLVDERDVHGMAECMSKFLRDPQLAGQMGMMGRSRIETRYSMDRSISGLLSIINSCVSS